jgi:hypothetical protein
MFKTLSPAAIRYKGKLSFTSETTFIGSGEASKVHPCGGVEEAEKASHFHAHANEYIATFQRLSSLVRDIRATSILPTSLSSSSSAISYDGSHEDVHADAEAAVDADTDSGNLHSSSSPFFS